MRIQTTRTVKDHVGWGDEPTDGMAAQANVRYAAILLVVGRLTVEIFTAKAIDRPAVLERIGDVAVVVDEGLAYETLGTIAEVEAGGERHERAVETPLGYPENPLPKTTLEAKFRRQAGHVLDAAAVDRTIELVDDLQALDDVTAMHGVLVP